MSLIRRAGRPGLIGTAARTAVIAGTAQATAGAVARRQQARAQESFEAQQAELARQQAERDALAHRVAEQAVAEQAPPPVPAPGGGGGPGDLLAQLAQLGELHAQGVLTDAEFAAAKAKLLA